MKSLTLLKAGLAAATLLTWSSSSVLARSRDGTPGTPPVAASTDELRGMVSSSCSGAIVNLNRTAQSPAVMLTNGHCIRKPYLNPGEVVLDIEPPQKTLSIGAGSTHWLTVNPQKVLYGTLSGTDIGLVELKETYQQLTEAGVRIYTLAKQDPGIGTRAKMISGHFKTKQSCLIGKRVHLQEAGHTYDGAMRLNECSVIHGNSGSPLLDESTEEIVAIVNTVVTKTAPIAAACDADSPCELDENREPQVRLNQGYAQRTSDIFSCVDANGNINLNLVDCSLPKPNP